MPVSSRYNHLYPDGIKGLLRVERHVFRERKLCSSPRIAKALEEAKAELAALPPMVINLIERYPDKPVQFTFVSLGFFAETPLMEQVGFLSRISNQGGNHRGDTSLWLSTQRRMSEGWDSGKLGDE